MAPVIAPNTPYIVILPRLYSIRFVIAGDLKFVTAKAKGLHIPAQCKLPAIPIKKAVNNMLDIYHCFYEVFFSVHDPLHLRAIHPLGDIVNWD